MNAEVRHENIKGDLWSLIFFRGLLVGLLGFFLVVFPRGLMTIMIIIMGAWWLIDGVGILVQSLRGRKANKIWILGVFSGLIGICGGLIIVTHPVLKNIRDTDAYMWILFVTGLIYGLNSVVIGWNLYKKEKQQLSTLFAGVFYLLFAIVIALLPYGKPEILIRIIGVLAIIIGILLIRQSIREKEKK